MEDDDSMFILLLLMVSLTAQWDTDASSEAGINLCARPEETVRAFIDISAAVHLFDHEDFGGHIR